MRFEWVSARRGSLKFVCFVCCFSICYYDLLLKYDDFTHEKHIPFSYLNSNWLLTSCFWVCIWLFIGDSGPFTFTQVGFKVSSKSVYRRTHRYYKTRKYWKGNLGFPFTRKTKVNWNHRRKRFFHYNLQSLLSWK